MAMLKAVKTKYDEAYKSLKKVEDVIEKLLENFESWGFRDDTFQPFWMTLDRDNSLYENRFRDKLGKIHTLRITKDGTLTVGQLTVARDESSMSGRNLSNPSSKPFNSD